MNSRISQPMSDKELEMFCDILIGFPDKNAMTLEMVDGFFAALHCSPDILPMSAYLPKIWGDETGDMESPFESVDKLNAFLQLVTQLWNEVGHRFKEGIFRPLLGKAEKEDAFTGNGGAQGFLRGAALSASFTETLQQEEKMMGYFVPIFALAYEHHDNPELRPLLPEAITPESRAYLLRGLAEGVTHIYRYFSSQRKSLAPACANESVRNSNKTGRNELCYCGSGKKHKKCCLH